MFARNSIFLWLAFTLLLSCSKTNEGSKSGIWESSLKQALIRSASQSKPVVIDFGAQWCKPCKRMHAEVFVEAGIEKRLRTQFVPVMVDATEMTPSVSKLLRAYQVNTLPTLVFLKPNGDFIPAKSLVGFNDVKELDARLSEVRTLVSGK